ncbi:biotin carboxylase N-terminal domain-containing protein [Bacillus sp. FJAT-50079]|uniref:acetyl-CoA carboxylase biotin carboxylase subunit n=1 Tax=Bacillus sp. FJAT-50079 TaxID=2833577 RepID=UPI001BC96FC1|nr:biotin carboxylase N-terminal domain-containing protein [Bacillus sp. FJAT-50079]MBS4207728.1 ATP-grasp domain-containing protein [Bacillus sp. FJAT-50079]
MKKILIANRGEIASRIIKTCKRMKIKTIAIYSDADNEMPFVQEADVSVGIGEAQVSKSYLQGDYIIETALRLGADAIHPGYGLLSEDSEFARKVTEAGICFIGPSHEIIALMGDKIASRRAMIRAGVPVVPGINEHLPTVEDAKLAAKQIGYPLMLKASSGGGGIGMQRCNDEKELISCYESIKKRAKSYFGDDAIFIEKCIDHARHIEVQIFGDKLGNIVQLFERNCSVQRRNQKVIEESPSPFLSDETKVALYKMAMEAAKATQYDNAGTVEFIVGPDEQFYFLEMNTRLQVEHPVTEVITGIDLVEWQIKVANGEKLPFKQTDLRKNGHAIEFRIYAEDPATYFPSPGKITKLVWPDGGRVDAGYAEGTIVSPYYDPLIAKWIVHGVTREECLLNAKRWIGQIIIDGIKTNIPYLNNILQNKAFQSGEYTTNILQRRKDG